MDETEVPAWFRIQGLTTYQAIADYIIGLQSENRELRKELKKMNEIKLFESPVREQMTCVNCYFWDDTRRKIFGTGDCKVKKIACGPWHCCEQFYWENKND
jgi:hypothetical protein